MAVGEGAIWVGACTVVARVDLATHSFLQAHVDYTIGSIPRIVLAGRAVWTTGKVGAGVGLVRLDPATGRQLAPLAPRETGRAVTALATGMGSVWVGSSTGDVLRIDPFANRVVHRFEVPGDVDAMAVGNGYVWALDRLHGRVFRLAVEDGRVRVGGPFPGIFSEIDVGAGTVWMLDAGAGAVVPLDERTGRPGPAIRVGERPVSLAFGSGAVWVADQGGTLWRINPGTRVPSPRRIGAPVATLGFDPSSQNLWLILARAE
jgi:streptogramin lyase